MSGAQIERRVRVVPGSIVDTIEIEPPVETFEQYRDVCAAAYGSIYGVESYKTLPQPLPSDFKRSLFVGATELRVFRANQVKLDKAGLNVARTLRNKYKMPATFEHAESIAQTEN